MYRFIQKLVCRLRMNEVLLPKSKWFGYSIGENATVTLSCNCNSYGCWNWFLAFDRLVWWYVIVYFYFLIRFNFAFVFHRSDSVCLGRFSIIYIYICVAVLPFNLPTDFTHSKRPFRPSSNCSEQYSAVRHSLHGFFCMGVLMGCVLSHVFFFYSSLSDF